MNTISMHNIHINNIHVFKTQHAIKTYLTYFVENIDKQQLY